jgi:hypothetical protein
MPTLVNVIAIIVVVPKVKKMEENGKEKPF